jgi:hypothetical protein
VKLENQKEPAFKPFTITIEDILEYIAFLNMLESVLNHEEAYSEAFKMASEIDDWVRNRE